jgi:hypothetical protein
MMFEIVGMVAAWLIGLAASFYVPCLIILRRPGGLETIGAAIYIGGGCAALYVAGSLIYFAAT